MLRRINKWRQGSLKNQGFLEGGRGVFYSIPIFGMITNFMLRRIRNWSKVLILFDSSPFLLRVNITYAIEYMTK